MADGVRVQERSSARHADSIEGASVVGFEASDVPRAYTQVDAENKGARLSTVSGINSVTCRTSFSATGEHYSLSSVRSSLVLISFPTI